ncbi:unnamed protein product [Phyllotreta striolata]|uniref:HP domain-containing protein n=1 Tax=Phyllotreta striolata TaxID=444603 RepID=A0A9N9TLP5_PHYSR|nr:unnamed protein product [Phyllotreta striolata]
MSENQETRLERIARYKQERRKQLDEQFASFKAPAKTTRPTNKDGNSSHSSDSPRPTITSKLRAAATSKSSANDSNECDTKAGSKRIERDKSNKRKSNLNRSLNSEEVPSSEGSTVGDVKIRRRRRRFFPAEVFETSGNEASTASLTPSSPTPKKIEPADNKYAAKYKPYKYKSTAKPNEPMRFSPKSSTSRSGASDDEKCKSVPARGEKKMESKPGQKSRSSKDKLCSILKKNSSDEIPVIVADASSAAVVGPVSILKRKASQDTKLEHHHSTNTPPVTFSPSVLEPSSDRRKQGILKKRRSLDESSVLRHRSCSPDKTAADSRSILKNQRRSSLEELRRTRSPDLHGILKHRQPNYDYDDHSLDSPQSILKRRSGGSGGGGGSPHVSIATAVILAAAGGAEMVLNSDGESVRPILKKKSSCEERAHCNDGAADAPPRPILKKKSSTDTEESSEERRRSILKLARSSLEFEALEIDAQSKDASEAEGEVAAHSVRPILKQTVGREESTRRLSFRSGTECDRWSRRSHTISSSDLEIESLKVKRRDEDGLGKPRPFSVSELVKSFEGGGSTGAVPKRNNNNKRAGNNRYKTQPVTFNELEASRNLVKTPQQFDDDRNDFEGRRDARSLLDFSSSLGRNAGQVKGFLASSMRSQRSPESVAGEKMSSDSAFQSLGDGLELEQIDESTRSSDADKNDEDNNPESCENVTNPTNRYQSRKYNSTTQLISRSITIEAIKTASKHSSKEESFLEDPSKTRSKSTDKDDEGISCNDSDSCSDSDATPKVRSLEDDEWTKKDREESRTKRCCDSSTSEGESSGGREIKSIFNSDYISKIRRTPAGGSSTTINQESFVDDSDLNAKSNRQYNMPQVIADITAKLQTSGESEWKKRLASRNNFNDELKLLKDDISSKKSQLDAALTNWKNRVEKSDAEKFSVAAKTDHSLVRVNLPSALETKSPHQKKFKLKQGSDSASTSPERNGSALIRSQSLSFSTKFNSTEYTKRIEDSSSTTKKSVTVLNPDDITMKKFFKTFDHVHHQADVSLADFDAVQRQSLLVIRKNVQVRKRKTASNNNPIKALASRSDISNEYTEILTGVAEREKKRLNIEKLAKNSDKALDALAGLASNEDFKSIALKKSSGQIFQAPWKDLMLLQIKGRRHVQTRLVEPIADSINEGDNYILITPSAYYTYTGAHSNVIEQSRMSDIVNHIAKTGDLGCKGKSLYALSAADKSSKHALDFWNHLGSDGVPEVAKAGHSNEDESYESSVLLTNMIYSLDGDELVPCDRHWGAAPRFEMLEDAAGVYVFDFGAEMYVWSGKNAAPARKRIALKVAKEMWSEGYDYSDCGFCPLGVASMLGDRRRDGESRMSGDRRPDWALFAKLTQHRETILFKEKFLDWPDFSRIIQFKTSENLDKANGSVDIRPCDVDEMLNKERTLPDLIVENVHMGRGDRYFDEETRRLFVYDTLNVTGWRIIEPSYEKLATKDLGTFYDGDSYIYRWDFRQTVRGRELNGNPSKHAAVGRDRCIFFYWQGCNSSIKEKGVAALLTVELDKENAPQIRVTQGAEPAAFLRLFAGKMTVQKGKRTEDDAKSRLFILRGEKDDEMYLMEVDLDVASLRSKSSFVLFDYNNDRAFIWHGAKSKSLKRKGVLRFTPESMKVVEMNEGSETEDFWNLLGEDRNLYHSLLDSNESFDHTIRMFNMCSLTGEFSASEILCPHRSEHSTPYPFVQSDLYSASQPALFLVDNDHELWLWQGYLPEPRHLEEDQMVSVRWQAERKAAMQTAVDYWKRKRPGERIKAYRTSAGSEPVAFTNLFPSWEVRTDIVELNKKSGRTGEGEMVPLERDLSLLSRTTYSLSELLERPLPEGVDPTNIEKYLSSEDFEQLLSMSKEEFDRLPSWKKTVLKKEKGLF